MNPRLSSARGLAAMLFLGGALLAVPAPQAPSSAPLQAPPAPGDAQPLHRDSSLFIGELPNGLTYMIRPTSEPKGRMSARLFIDVGSLNETAEVSGISHFIEHLVFNGSRTFKRGELIPAMQRLGLGFGGDANAYTGLEQTVYLLDLPNLNDETVDFALTIMRDFADGATLAEEAIDKERGIIVSELKARDSMAYRAMVNQLGCLLAGTRVAGFMPIGKEEVIRNVTPRQIRDYYGSHYVPRNMTLILTGDITPGQATRWVEKYFGSMERKPSPAPRNVGQLDAQDSIRARVFPNSEQGTLNLSITAVTPARNQPDSMEKRLAEIPQQMAELMLNLRLDKLSQAADAPFLSASAGNDTMFRVADMVSISAQCNPQQWKQALQAIDSELRGACRYGFQPAEFREARAIMENALKNRISSWNTVAAADMAKSLVASLARNELPTDPAEDMRIFETAMKSMTSEQCREALCHRWEAAPAAVSAMGKAPKELTDETLLQVYAESLKSEAAKPAAAIEKPFAYDSVGSPGKIAAEREVADLGVTQLELGNGVRVNLKPTPFTQGKITVKAALDGGKLSQPKGKPGLNALAAAVVNLGGLEAHSAIDLQRLFAGRTVGVSFSVDDDRFLFSGTTTPEDLELQLKLLAAQIAHPGYRPEAEMQFRRALPATYAQLKHEPGGAYRMRVSDILFNSDERFSFPEQNVMEQRTTDEVREWLAPWLKDGSMEVTLVGDFDPAAVKPLLERTLGAMPARKAAPGPLADGVRKTSVAPWGKSCTIPYDSAIDRTIVSRIFPAGNGRDLRRNRRLSLLAGIARERVFDGLRAALGEAYGPSVSMMANEAYEDSAMISVVSAGILSNRAKVNAAINTIVVALGNGTITQDELDRVVKPQLASLGKKKRSNAYWSAMLGKSQAEPDYLSMIRDAEKDIASVTLNEINALSRSIFGSGKGSTFFILPNAVPGAPKVEKQPEDGARETEEAPSLKPASPGELADPAYAVLISAETAQQKNWLRVAEKLCSVHRGRLIVLPGTLKECGRALRSAAPRYLAIVGRPEEFDREAVNVFHRETRRIDSDPYGDCIWGIITGRSADDAMRLAEDAPPLMVKRAGGTTNIDPARFEASSCITDWAPFHVREQRAGRALSDLRFDSPDAPGKDAQAYRQDGIVLKFKDMLENDRLQLLVTSSHATPYNLEMPFEKGLIVSGNGRYHMLAMKDKAEYVEALRREPHEGEGPILDLLARRPYPEIRPDGETRIWLAAGNCLFGDAHRSGNSMAVTALSSYGCRQLAGYTVPSWYGAAGWGTLDLLFNNHDASSFAEAWYLNNQLILERTLRSYPVLMNVAFNADSIDAALRKDSAFLEGIVKSGYRPDKDVLGLAHDRDVLAFYGDPLWVARLDESRAASPWHIDYDGSTLTVTANRNAEGNVCYWFPARRAGEDTNAARLATPSLPQGIPLPQTGVLTNDFLIIRQLKLNKGEQATVTFPGSAEADAPAS